MCVERNIEARSRNHCCSGKAISITYSVFMLVALVTQDATCMRHIIVCGLPRCTIFLPHYLINNTIFEKCHRIYNVYFDILYKLVSNISRSKTNQESYYQKLVVMYRTRFSFQISTKLEFRR